MAAKRDLRARLAERRAGLDPVAVEAAGGAVAAEALSLLPTSGPVTAYAALPDEPPTGPLLDRLLAAGREVLLPVLLPDDDLDWAVLTHPAALRPGRLGLLEPIGRRLGVAAVTDVAGLVVPALAVDRAGRRLGRGGGSYDRALARVRPGVPAVALVHDHELLDSVPAGPADQPVSGVATPTRALRLPAGPGTG